MRRIVMGLTSGVLGAGVMFGYLAAVAPATAQTPNDTDTSVVTTTTEVPSELVIPEVAAASTDVVTTTEPTRTPVEVPIQTGEPAAPRTFMVPVDWCPQEDSCYADYRSDGHWYVVEGQRPW